MRLATFVHVSDLHFGYVDPESINKDAVPVAMGSVGGPIFDGLLGHSHNSLVRLEQLWAKLKREEDASVIVTGDLTAFGAVSQFELATTYLADVLKPPKVASPIGLRQRAWSKSSIPGNHDHWPGRPVILGAPTSGLTKHFSGLPNVFRFNLSTGQFLTFLLIDSDADVNPMGSDRLFARGRFNSELETLSSRLPIPQTNEIRVLLLHHSFSATGRTLAITSRSKDALNDFIVDHGISVLLCGHIHQPPLVETLQAVHLQQTRTFIEARSGTTTQISTLPFHWKNLLGRRPRRPDRWPNSLLVHRLFEEPDASVKWHTETYLESPYGFRASPQLPGGLPGTLEFTVWSP